MYDHILKTNVREYIFIMIYKSITSPLERGTRGRENVCVQFSLVVLQAFTFDKFLLFTAESVLKEKLK